MKTVWERFRALRLNTTSIGLEPGPEESDWFCAPVGLRVFGWDGALHYGFVEGQGEKVFCVNPENFGDRLVYPLAEDFEHFVRLLLAARNANTLQQIIGWDEAQYEAFRRDPDTVDWDYSPEVCAVLDTLACELGLTPLEEPFRYVKALQAAFDYDSLRFSGEYYDTLGLERPGGGEPEREERWAPADVDPF